MPVGDTAFSTSVFSVDVAGVGRHPNPVTCVVRGRRGPLTVVGQGQSVTGDIVIIRPGVEHHIICGEGGLSAMYLDGARWPGRWQSPGTLAERLDGRLGELVLAGMQLDSDAQRELRERLDHGQGRLPRRISAVLAKLAEEPMARMSQAELAERLGLERTQALRLFKEFHRDDLPPIQAVDWTAACCAPDRSRRTRENGRHGRRLRRHCAPDPDFQTMLRTDAVPSNRRFAHDWRVICQVQGPFRQ